MGNMTRMLIFLSACIISYRADNFELECPDECECHYFRINWVTDCSESNLTEIPYDELSHSVYILDMNGNNVARLKKFRKNIKLRRLQLAHNQLKLIEKSAFEGLDYLIDVDLSANQIATIDPHTFASCPGLLTLELQENALQPIEGPFLISRSLQYLDLSYCNMSELNVDFFMNVSALHTLDLSGNPLRTLDSGVFDYSERLEQLLLNDCSLTFIGDNTFVYLENLKKLELSKNYFVDIDWIMVLGTLHHLEHLDLRDSKITNLQDDVFMNCTYLNTLILADNDLSDMDVAMTLGSNMNNLETLDLSNCHLTGPLTADAFSNSSGLKTLNLSGNPLYVIDLQMALEPLSNLERLFLSKCGLKQLPKSFSTLKQLEELDISHNPLNDAFIKILAPLDKLEYLNMGFSNLSHIGANTFAKMTSMKRLVLSGNNLRSLEAGLFGNLTQLESLELNFCNLSRTLNASLFFDNVTYSELKELKISGNPLIITKEKPLLPGHMSGIQILDLSSCNITFLPDNAFKRIENITILNLSGNRFNSDSGLKFLQLLPKLEQLDLSSNNLTTITPNVFVRNPKISSLRLIGNPWKCECGIAEMWDWASMVKGDLSILVGSKTSPDDFTLKGSKRKKSLVCYYEDGAKMRETISSNRSIIGRRPFVKPQRQPTSMNRTWAKYVRESGCEPVVRILQPLTLVSSEAIDEIIMIGPSSWFVIAFGVSLVFITASIVGLIGRRRNKLKISPIEK